MQNLKSCIEIAKLFGQEIRIGLDHKGNFLVNIPYTWKKNDSILTSFCGRHENLDQACLDFLNNCTGLVVCRSPDSTKEHVINSYPKYTITKTNPEKTYMRTCECGSYYCPGDCG